MKRKEERSKQGQTNNKAKQHSTPKTVTFPKKNELPRVHVVPCCVKMVFGLPASSNSTSSSFRESEVFRKYGARRKKEGREGGRERGREGGKEGVREERREGERDNIHIHTHTELSLTHTFSLTHTHSHTLSLSHTHSPTSEICEVVESCKRLQSQLVSQHRSLLRPSPHTGLGTRHCSLEHDQLRISDSY